MRNVRNIVVSCAVTAPVWFWIGRLTSEPDPQPIQIELAAAPWVEQAECVCQPTECPVIECPMWPMHKKALAAKLETAKMDAYLRGAESIWWATESCEHAFMHGPPTCSIAAEQVWDVEYDLSMLNLRVNMESVENHNWWKACRELLRVWPTESEVEGNYPEDFPKYCW